MTIDIATEGSPGWWLKRCADKLDRRRDDIQGLWSRFEGDAPIPSTYTTVIEDAYRQFRKLGRVNFCEKIVLSRADRMRVVGFRTAVANDTNGDPVAAKVWDSCGMNVEMPEVIVKMLAMRDSYVMISVDDAKRPIMTGEDAREVVTIHDPSRQQVVRAGLKLYHDADEGRDYAYLHLPANSIMVDRDNATIAVTGPNSGRMWVATRKRRSRAKVAVKFSAAAFDWSPEHGGAAGVETGIKRVPIVRFRNKHGKGEFEPHLDLLDGLDQGSFEKRVVSAYQAWRQRALAVPAGADEDDNGKPVDWDDLLSADPGATWVMPENTKFWESMASDLRPQIDSLQHDIRVVADVTSTPMRSFHSDAAGGSAEGAASQREDLVFRVEDRIARVGEGIRDVMSIAFELTGDKDRMDRDQITVLWTAPDRRSLAEMADAWSKTDGLPLAVRLRLVFQMTPNEIADVLEQQQTEALEALMMARQQAKLVTTPAPPALPAGSTEKPAALPAGAQRQLVGAGAG